MDATGISQGSTQSLATHGCLGHPVLQYVPHPRMLGCGERRTANPTKNIRTALNSALRATGDSPLVPYAPLPWVHCWMSASVYTRREAMLWLLRRAGFLEDTSFPLIPPVRSTGRVV